MNAHFGSKLSASRFQELANVFMPYQELTGEVEMQREMHQDSLNLGKDDSNKPNSMSNKSKRPEEEPQLYKSISIKSQALSQENVKKTGTTDSQASNKRTISRQGANRKRSSESRNSPKYADTQNRGKSRQRSFIDIPQAYHGAYTEN